ncbi:RNA 2',3'-cyclic phosphodiesterase [Paenibacillus sp. TRM 82003]|nr:RNA 2',3'-cyclic phosphodiesterase [Paenibacillus sp. TRM 82003]
MNQELANIQRSLRRIDPSGKYEPAENYHLTLRYIGESLDSDTVAAHLERIGYPAFTLRLHRLGIFDNPDRNVVWVNVMEDDPLDHLRTLQRKIDRALSDSGCRMKRYSFVPHISLAYDCKDTISNAFPNCTVAPSPFNVTAFHLYVVQYTPEGPRFRKLKQFELTCGEDVRR